MRSDHLKETFYSKILENILKFITSEKLMGFPICYCLTWSLFIYVFLRCGSSSLLFVSFLRCALEKLYDIICLRIFFWQDFMILYWWITFLWHDSSIKRYHFRHQKSIRSYIGGINIQTLILKFKSYLIGLVFVDFMRIYAEQNALLFIKFK